MAELLSINHCQRQRKGRGGGGWGGIPLSPFQLFCACSKVLFCTIHIYLSVCLSLSVSSCLSLCLCLSLSLSLSLTPSLCLSLSLSLSPLSHRDAQLSVLRHLQQQVI